MSFAGISAVFRRPLKGCSLAFPLRLRSRAAFALVCTHGCCEKAQESLQQLQQQQWLPKGEARVAPHEGTQLSPKDTQSAGAAFLLTICLYVDDEAEEALARICPAAAVALAEAAAIGVEAARAEADKEEMSTKLQVEMDDSSSSDESCSVILHGSTRAKAATEGSIYDSSSSSPSTHVAYDERHN